MAHQNKDGHHHFIIMWLVWYCTPGVSTAPDPSCSSYLIECQTIDNHEKIQQHPRTTTQKWFSLVVKHILRRRPFLLQQPL